MADNDQNHEINPVQIQKFLGGVNYPATRDDLVEAAKKNNAPQDVVEKLQNLPDGEQYQTPADVNQELS